MKQIKRRSGAGGSIHLTLNFIKNRRFEGKQENPLEVL